MTALYHFFEIIRTERTTKCEWLFCTVCDEQKAHSKLLELRTNNPDKEFICKKIK